MVPFSSEPAPCDSLRRRNPVERAGRPQAAMRGRNSSMTQAFFEGHLYCRRGRCAVQSVLSSSSRHHCHPSSSSSPFSLVLSFHMITSPCSGQKVSTGVDECRREIGGVSWDGLTGTDSERGPSFSTQPDESTLSQIHEVTLSVKPQRKLRSGKKKAPAQVAALKAQAQGLGRADLPPTCSAEGLCKSSSLSLPGYA